MAFWLGYLTSKLWRRFAEFIGRDLKQEDKPSFGAKKMTQTLLRLASSLFWTDGFLFFPFDVLGGSLMFSLYLEEGSFQAAHFLLEGVAGAQV